MMQIIKIKWEFYGREEEVNQVRNQPTNAPHSKSKRDLNIICCIFYKYWSPAVKNDCKFTSLFAFANSKNH